MIGRLTGLIAEKSPPQVLVDVNGVGYELDVPMSTFYHLPGLGERTTLLTHFVVREDAQVLFGFLTHDERSTFRQLVRISGVGPRTALAILSGLSVAEISFRGVQHRYGDRVVLGGVDLVLTCGDRLAARAELLLREDRPRVVQGRLDHAHDIQRIVPRPGRARGIRCSQIRAKFGGFWLRTVRFVRFCGVRAPR